MTCRRITLIAATVLLACVAACTSPSGVKSSPSSAPTEPAPPSWTPASSGDEPVDVIQLGDLNAPVDAVALGAPFDPCAIGWAAFPAQVRPHGDPKPRLRIPTKDDSFDISCRYDSSDAVPLDQGSQAGGTFLAVIAWATPGRPGGLVVDTAKYPGSTPATFAGKPGLIRASENSDAQAPLCLGVVGLANGTAGLSITNSRFPNLDACSVVAVVAEAVAATTP